ncbi:sugar ABC transporter substrate-binding protein [Microbacterium album]|uniref:Periplasmic binding protein domain-containing protein n=1 Tax=Microbacterium album TaxID=2053191 RepID=A0A917IBZ0_9MICO|nr:sugar ABC transporter substrate-binding protein [Microbacterium album]GGH33535.1 hypothetical protein GCM10010921_00540 [Microbacterium album]
MYQGSPPTRARGAARRLALTTAAMLALVVSGCSSDAEPDGVAPTKSAPGSAAFPAEEALAHAYEGVMGAPPEAPVNPIDGLDAWIVSVGEASPTGAIHTAALTAAMDTLGWRSNVCDGQLNPGGWSTCIRQAIATSPDVIFTHGIDCASVAEAYQEARNANIAIMGSGGVDCDLTGGEPLWTTHRVLMPEWEDERGYYDAIGALAADWVIGQTDGAAKVLLLDFIDPAWGPWMRDGFLERIAECDGCEVTETVEIANADMGPALVTKFESVFLANPEVNSVFMPLSAWASMGIGQSIIASGRSADIHAIAGFGDSSALDAIRGDLGLDALVGVPHEWTAWGAVDTMLRALQGEEAQPIGAGIQIIDKDHNMPESGGFTAGVDHEAAYSALWGVAD